MVCGWETEKHKTTRGWTGGCWHAASTSGDETKILAAADGGHSAEEKNGFEIVLPQPNKVQYDFFHLEHAGTHTPTREVGCQVNVFRGSCGCFHEYSRI